MYEIDQVLFGVDLSKLLVQKAKSQKTVTQPTDQNYIQGSVTSHNLQGIARIIAFMSPRIPIAIQQWKSNFYDVKFISLKIPDSNNKLAYSVMLGDLLPTFYYIPSSMEIIHRLVLRAATAKDIQEFQLKKS